MNAQKMVLGQHECFQAMKKRILSEHRIPFANISFPEKMLAPDLFFVKFLAQGNPKIPRRV